MPKITVNGGPSSYLHEVLEGPAPEPAEREVVPETRAEPSPGVFENPPEVLAGLVRARHPHDYSDVSFVDLRSEARKRGLSSGGTRDDIITRLIEDDEP